jgi:hypothetical protein
MLYFELADEAYCAGCNKWIGINDIYQPDGSENEGRLNCLKCDSIIGYTWDKEWLRMIDRNCCILLD